MIIDTSAIIAMLKFEADGEEIMDRVLDAKESCKMSAAQYLEAGIVADSEREPVKMARLDEILEMLSIELAPVTPSQAKLARQAYRDFGRGSGHPAKLNFGDCFAYALAVDSGQPLLFKGNDFTHTGIERA